MATPVVAPRLGTTIESCLLSVWRKKEGEQVQAGEIVCEIETDKAVFEVESPAGGVLLKWFFREGDEVPVMGVMAVVGKPGEDVTRFTTPAQVPSPEGAPAHAGPADVPAGPIPTSGAAGVSPRAANLATSRGIDPGSVAGTGPGGRVIERDITRMSAGRAPLTPAARDMLAKGGLTVPPEGSGIGGRVRAADLAGVAEADMGPAKEVPVRGARKTIAARMLDSVQTTAQVTINAHADARGLLALREEYKADKNRKITINDLVLFAVSRVLAQSANLNAHFLGDRILEYERVHLGMAVDTPRGLMVPVIRDAHLKSLKQVSAETHRLAQAANDGKLAPADMNGATFTVTNLGATVVETFTPLLNPPQVGVLGIGTIEPGPVAKEGGWDTAPRIGLSLTFDHRAVDGRPAAVFLGSVAAAIANIAKAII
jgi:pyruvate dehydrogenase E2 component (dihydrolipoamide acetyltransferase)